MWRRCHEYFGRKKVTKVIFTGKEVLVPNEEAVAAVTKNLGGANLIIGIGSGVIQDLCKYVAFENNLPYFIVASAPSMDGYTSSGAAMILGGMKVTYASKVPEVEALIVVGIAMSFVGNSRPASGSEHHLSHFFEIVGIERGEEYFPHGIDVIYSSVITQMIRERILGLPDFKRKQFEISREVYVKRMKEVYGYAADGCISLQDKLKRYNQDRVSIYIEKEEEIRAVLQETPSTEEMIGLLAKMEMDIKDFYALYSKEKIIEAVFWAKELKERYTVLWIYFDLFGVRELLE